MDIQIKDQLFIVGGATSGLGKAVAEALIAEGANIIAVARNEEKLKTFQQTSPTQIEIFAGDLAEENSIHQLIKIVGNRQLHGILINAGGPPAKTVLETTLADWDDAYKNILRWKVALTKAFAPMMIQKNYGRILFLESSSVKQPIENLVLSNSLRLAVIGFAKTFAQEISKSGVTLNIIAPGAHDTPAITRLHVKKSEQTGMPLEQVRKEGIAQMPTGALGNANDFASLAVWLLSPVSKFITGQTITVDGGTVKSIFG
ncbi:3-oxoacyl-[acyl-carrier-protein] reductase FabG [mine drainage metagenome]|uniref:3-oxoacyl-[acyl-carrier-protein] reductase FabG n=1 Tax=mine drainage metagenome TaxID=410659 RepID=A0A1J5SZD2_9ZZZZ